MIHKHSCPGCPLCRLTDPQHPEYLAPEPLCPGVGLPGILWNEATTSNPNRYNLFSQRSTKKKVVWRDVKSLSQDPDQPTNPRLDGLVEAGLGLAAGITFNNGDQEGIVMFIARKSVAAKKIKSPVNEAYLIAASDLIGSAWALRGPRHAAVEAREEMLAQTIRRARVRLLTIIRLGVNVEDLAKPLPAGEVSTSEDALEQKVDMDKGKTIVSRIFNYTRRKARQLYIKSIQGGMNQPPPPMSTAESLFSAVGTFLTMIIVTQLAQHMVDTYGLEYRIVVGPLGALATLHYGLTAAPASQPRNALMGQLVALTIAIAISKSQLETWMKQSLAAASTVLVITRLGIIHPPAGASAVIFSGSSSLGWSQMGSFLLAYVVIICCSTIINNLNAKRQYPTYWGVGFILDYFKKDEDKEAEKERAGKLA